MGQSALLAASERAVGRYDMLASSAALVGAGYKKINGRLTVRYSPDTWISFRIGSIMKIVAAARRCGEPWLAL